jgi:HEPN domain-containing protein/ribosomal protein S27E
VASNPSKAIPRNQHTTLLDSAVAFLIEAFVTYTAKKQSFAIVHAVTAAELVLKERLARVHPNLIYEDIDARSVAKKTVSLYDLPQRLLNLGVKIEPEEIDLVRQCAKWRNEIVHHLPAFDHEEAEVQFPKLLDFIAAFMRRELGTGLKKVLPTRWYRKANQLLKEWQHAVKEAQDQATQAGNVLAEICPECGSSDVLSVGNQSKVYCHLCGFDSWKYGECGRCKRVGVLSFFLNDKHPWCINCQQELERSLRDTEQDLDLFQLPATSA